MTQHRARKRFGQHFLTDPQAIDDILRAINASSDDHIVEIGPGQGALTNALAQRAGQLTLVELDRDLVARLQQRYVGHPHVTIVSGDALKVDFSALGSSLRIVGNLPYNISTPLLFHLSAALAHTTDMHFMLQKEVVDRICATPGNKQYGRLSVMLQCCFEPLALFDVGPAAFDPPPKVDSAVIRLTPRAQIAPITRTPLFERLVRDAFSQRRKTIRNTLRQHLSAEQIVAAGADPQARAETLDVGQFVQLTAAASAAPN
ncbi:MAG: 16S rRNA (adenine(1518)-N(6)/adenine(1519)-N(6))-dimethyltransferase RsmA [Pseudomonadota bacterium]